VSQPQTTERRLTWPRWLLVALALAGSALSAATTGAGLPTWLTVGPAIYLLFASTGTVAVLCLPLRLRGLPVVLLIVAGSVSTTVLAGVVLDLASISVTGSSLAVADIVAQLAVVTVGLYLTWMGRRLDFWSELLGTQADPPVGSARSVLGIAVAGVGVLGLVVTLILAARSQHPQSGIAYSSFAFTKEDPALAGELTVKRAQVLDLGLELDTEARPQQVIVASVLGTAAGPSITLEPVTSGQFSGHLLIAAPTRAGRFELTISTANPTYVAPTAGAGQSPGADPATVSGQTAEAVNSAPRLQVTVWLDVT
jgi:hypothetical protein